MREIKYKAWDKEKKIFVMVLEICFNYFQEINKIKVQYESGVKRYLFKGTYDLIEYTGLKDKNGTEIYNGDIIKIVKDKNQKVSNVPHEIKYGELAKVEWSETNLAYYLFSEKGTESQMDYYGAWEEWNWLEVVGNTHEVKHERIKN